MKLTTADAYKLMHDGALVLAAVEQNGMRIDVDLLDETIKKVERRIRKLEKLQKESEEWHLWKKRYGERSSLGSRHQLAKVLVEDMGHKVGAITKKNNIKMDEEQLSKIGGEFIRRYLDIEKLKKLKSTYLLGIRREVLDGFLHPVFNLNMVRTFRSSSSDPNFQNIPIRDKKLGKLIRSCFIPRDGHVLVEIDYSALEVRIAACYHKDPVMLEYIADPSKDMHRDMAAECFMLDPSEVQKELRFYAKNCFVFPEFYGSYWRSVAPNLWENCRALKLADGTSIEEHLACNGIDGLGEHESNYRTGRISSTGFYDHIRKVEDDFWGRRFKVYANWKEWWWNRYQDNGWFQMKTGFRCSGIMARNDVINYPVQGAAFHCLLWSLIQMVKLTRKWKTKIVGQIHDSIVADVHRDELDDYLSLAKDVMTKRIRKAWPWIIVPLEIEVEVGEQNWFEKQEVKLP